MSNGTLLRCAAARMCAPSALGPRPRGLLTTRWISPRLMRSTPSSPSSSSLATSLLTGIPAARSAAAVPVVATSEKPSWWNTSAASQPRALSRSASDRNTVPFSGSGPPAAIWLFMKARPVVRSMPMTSPVERISGPSSASASGKRLNGKTASLTATWSPATGSASSPLSRSSSSVAPSITRAAIFTNGTPVALATKGTVRDARGLASMTNT